jgi:hypothetical protein
MGVYVLKIGEALSRPSTATLLLLGMAILCLAPRAGAQGFDVAVVVNSDNAATKVSQSDLRKMLNGTKRAWPGGKPIKIVTRGPGCHERLVLLRFLAMSESEYKQYWTAQVLRGEADAEPMTVPSVGMQKEAMKVFPGTISLVNAGEVIPGMKVIKVDGLLPGEPGYPLH